MLPSERLRLNASKSESLPVRGDAAGVPPEGGPRKRLAGDPLPVGGRADPADSSAGRPSWRPGALRGIPSAVSNGTPNHL